MTIIPTCPPAAKIAEYLNLGIDTARAIRKRVKQGIEYDRGHYSHSVCAFMEEIGKLSDFHHGVESLYLEKPHIFYLNAGDTYATTLIYNYNTDTLRLGCWGDLVGA